MKAFIQHILHDQEQLFLALFAVVTFIQLLYYFVAYARVAFLIRNKNIPQDLPPVSVIICAKNESHNLTLHLSKVLSQDYPNFEVIVVDDCSEDDTGMVLAEYKKQYPHLKITSIAPDRKFTHGKKLAVTVGIKAASNEWLVFTDADCYPLSDKWLQYMARNFQENTQIVLGYGGMQPRATLLNNYIRYDTFFIGLQYMGYALCGNPYMGIGRNLAYRKSLFFRTKGFARHYHLFSGDDDLFVNENAHKRNTKVELHPESITRSEGKTTWGALVNQKSRHFTTYKHYKWKHKFLLGFESFTRLLFYAGFAYLVLADIYLYHALVVFGIRFVVQFIIFTTAQIRLKEKYIWPTSPIFDVVSLFINFGIDLTKHFRTGRGKWL